MAWRRRQDAAGSDTDSHPSAHVEHPGEVASVEELIAPFGPKPPWYALVVKARIDRGSEAVRQRGVGPAGTRAGSAPKPPPGNRSD